MIRSIRYDVPLSGRILRSLPVIVCYLILISVIFVSLGPSVRRMTLNSVYVIGLIGAIRYVWLIVHCVRAFIYEHYTFSKIRFAANNMAEEGKYPQRVFIVIPTFREKKDVSIQMINSVLNECAAVTSDATIVINSGSEEEDELFRNEVAKHSAASKIKVLYVRQKGGKRGGMADSLYALIDEKVDKDDVLILMDGDTVLGKGIFEACLPLFILRPNLGALTTDNISVTTGNWLYRKWYTLRFSMRHRMMKSQSLSNQLLVLTGRFSLFRASRCLNEEFISFLENDRIKHWMFGEIKFVTGDDKSTWYCLLRKGCEMLYVPDAHIFCMEDSGTKPVMMSINKMYRWFGNMLRNNGRAIGLGMGCQSPFIWWCHVDQRISMFTSLLGPMAAIWGAIFITPYYLVIYAIVVILTRLLYLMIMVFEGHRLSLMDIPLLLYTQWVGSIVKIYSLFHLHRQKWDSHRRAGNDQASRVSFLDMAIPKIQFAFSFFILIMCVVFIVGI